MPLFFYAFVGACNFQPRVGTLCSRGDKDEISRSDSIR